MKRRVDLEALIRRNARVERVAVAEAGDGTRRAYYYAQGWFAGPDLRRWYAATEGDTIERFVPVDRLPLADEGTVDLASLWQLPDLEDASAAALEAHALATDGVTQAKVLRQPAAFPAKTLHLSDLIPNWNTGAAQPEPSDIRQQESAGAQPVSDKLSVSLGGPLPDMSAMPQTARAMLERAVADHPANGVRYIRPDGSMTEQPYTVLHQDALSVLGGLQAAQLAKGDKALLQFADQREFITALWACLLGGIIPIPVGVAPSYTEDNAVLEKLHNAWELLGYAPILTSEAHRSAIESGRERFSAGKFQVVSIDGMIDGPAGEPAETATADIAIMLLTSGSTGASKAVRLSHSNITRWCLGASTKCDFNHTDVSLNWMPMDHVAGILYFHFRDVFNAAQQIHAPTEVVLESPLTWIDWLERYKVTLTFAPNFAYGLVNDLEAEVRERDWDLSHVRYVMNGAEAIVANTARKFTQLMKAHGLAEGAMTPSWGMSETSSGMTFCDRYSLETVQPDDSFVSVGGPIPGSSIRIVDSNDQPVPEGVEGRLQVTGENVFTGYYLADRINRDDHTQDGWFATGDLGRLDDGRLKITGREKDVIIINGVNFYSHDIEGVVEQIPGIQTSFTAAVAVRPTPGAAEALAVFFHTPTTDPDDLRELMREIRRQVVRRVGVPVELLFPVAPEAIPKTNIGKIQRSKLVIRYEAGEFADLQKQVDCLIENANSLPSWFFTRTWQRCERIVDPRAERDGGLLCFVEAADADGAPNEACVVVAGQAFEQHSAKRFTIRPRAEEDLAQVFATLGAMPASVVHAWNDVRTLYSVVRASKAYPPAADRSRWLVVTRGGQPELAGSAPTNLFAAASTGWVLTANQELSWMQASHVDIGGEADLWRVVDDEFASIFDETEIAWRGGERSTTRLVEQAPSPTRSRALTRSGCYLLTGGAGGIGRGLVKGILADAQARCLVVGRSAADADSVQELLAGEDGDRVVYKQLDVADGAALEAAVQESLATWGCDRLDGVFHLAGTYTETTIIDSDPELVDSILRSRIEGSLALQPLLERYPEARLIGASSVNGHFGGYSVSAYAAGCAAVEAFCADQAQRRPGFASSFAFSMWDGVGVANQASMRSVIHTRGYRLLPFNKALASWHALLATDVGYCAVGLDGSHPAIRCDLAGSVARADGWAGAFAAPIGTTIAKDAVKDSAGQPVVCRWVRMDSLPLAADGSIDVAQTQALLAGGGRGDAAFLEPESDLEQQLAKIWKEVLDQDRVGVEDNFFDLGGTSVLMSTVNGRIRRELEREVATTDLFQHPTIRTLAAFLAGEKDERAEAEFAQSEARGARRRERLKKRRRTDRS